MNAQDTQITDHAIRCFFRFLQSCTRVAGPINEQITLRQYSWAAFRLRELIPTANYRATDTQGRELWKSPPSAYGLRWLLAYEQDRKIRKVIWVGAMRPPRAMWKPENDD